MTILALDLGTKTGVAYGAAGAPPSRITTETWALPSGGGDEVGPIMHELRKRLHDRIISGIELVVFEAPFIARHRGHDGKWRESPHQIRRAFGMAAICEEVACARSVPVIEAVTSTLKKEFAGHGRSDKSDMIAAAKRRGFAPANDHEADALACWLHGVTHLHREHAHLYDPLFGGAR